MNTAPALATCKTCGKASWNKATIKWCIARFKAYYCKAHSPLTLWNKLDEMGMPQIAAALAETQKPDQDNIRNMQVKQDMRDIATQKPPKEEVSAFGNSPDTAEPVYQRPQEEVQAELEFLQTHSIEDIPF